MAFAPGAKYVPDPTIREVPVQAYAHCPDPRCPGTAQEQVSIVKTVVEWTFASRGGGDDPGGLGNMFLPWVENTQEHLRFERPEDVGCPHCSKPRELSVQERPVIPLQIGGANALLRLQEMGVGFDPERQQQIAAGAPETPNELLQRRYINDEITEDEFAAKRAMLAGSAVADPTATQDERIAVMQAQLDQLLGLVTEPAPEPKRGPGRPKNPPREA